MATSEMISDLAQRALSASDIEVVDVELRGAAGDRIVQITVDKPGGVTVDDCADVSLLISELLDAEDPISGPYRLEVASPGAERPLRTPEEFARAVGRGLEIVQHDGQTFAGTLTASTTTTVIVDVGTESAEIDLDDIARARTTVELGPARNPKREKNKTTSSRRSRT